MSPWQSESLLIPTARRCTSSSSWLWAGEPGMGLLGDAAHKEECKMANPYTTFSPANQPQCGTLANYMYHN